MQPVMLFALSGDRHDTLGIIPGELPFDNGVHRQVRVWRPGLTALVGNLIRQTVSFD